MKNKQLEIENKLLELLFKNSIHTAFYNLVLAITAIYFLPRISILSLSTILWLALMILAVFMRFFSGLFYKKYSPNLLFYLQVISILITGILWGTLYWQYYENDGQFQSMFILLVMVGISAASLISMAPSRLCYLAFTLPMILSVLINNVPNIYAHGGPIIALAVIYYVFLVSIHKQNYNLLVKNYNLEVKKNTLISILNKKNQTDYLTRLLNRKSFKQIAKKELYKAKLTKHQLSIILCDIDDFKKINDKYGHHVGDEILKHISHALKAKCPNSHIARIGGDEFAILSTHLNTSEHVISLAKEILSLTQSDITIKGYRIRTSLSLGIASYPHAGNDIEQLERNADIALYKSKEQGKNQYVIFSHALYHNYLKDELIYEAICQPFEQHFTFHYQPIYDTKNNKPIIKGIELLLRPTFTFGEVINVSDILQIAQKRGLMTHFGLNILNQAFNEISQISKSIRNCFFSINISTYLINQKSLQQQLFDLANQYNVNPNTIMLELAEPALISSGDTNIAVLKQLKSYGFKIAIDNFGKGYSSLSYLSQLPSDTLKLDVDFVQKIVSSQTIYIMIKWIIQLAKDLNLDVIAEGVETQQQYDMIKSLGCYSIQGYLLSQPLTKQALLDASLEINALSNRNLA